MAELTELGFLEQPHTSAGRIPSDVGYRLYINELMKKKAVPKTIKHFINSSLNVSFDTPEDLLNLAAVILANITKCAVISEVLFSEDEKIININVIENNKHVAIMTLTTSTGKVKSKFFRLPFILRQKYLDLLNRILNENFLGLVISQIDWQLAHDVAARVEEASSIVADVMLVFLELCSEFSKNIVHIEGQANLLFGSDFDLDYALNLMDYLKHRDSVERLFLEAQENENTLIGREINKAEFNNSSIITKKYYVNGKEFGSIGLIAPMRIDYGSVISCMDYLISEVEDILRDFLEL